MLAAGAPVALAMLLALANQLTGAFPVLVYAPVLAANGASDCPGADINAFIQPSLTMLPIVVSTAKLASAPKSPQSTTTSVMFAAP